jgi:uncharacterized membrane protein YbhN (UPF0104 family)
MDKKISNIIKYILSAGVAVLLLYFSFREVKWEDFMEGLRTCRWEFIVLSMAAGILAFWFRGIRWRQLLLPIDPSTKRITTFNAVNIGYIANFVFPRIGEFVRCGVVTRRSAPEASGVDYAGLEPANVGQESASAGQATKKKASYDKVLGTVVLERGWDMLTMLLLLVVLLSARWEKFGGFFMTQMWEPLSARLDFSIWWIVVILAVSGASFFGIVWKFRNSGGICSKIWGLFSGLLQGFSSCFRMKDKWQFLLSTALIWSMYWLMAASTMWAIPVLDGLNMIDALFLSLAGSLGWLVPVPSGFGAFHFVVSLALQAIYGIPFETGIIFATLSHESQAITMALFGGGSYAYESLKK